jgi:hypothetical protein
MRQERPEFLRLAPGLLRLAGARRLTAPPLPHERTRSPPQRREIGHRPAAGARPARLEAPARRRPRPSSSPAAKPAAAFSTGAALRWAADQMSGSARSGPPSSCKLVAAIANHLARQSQ